MLDAEQYGRIPEAEDYALSTIAKGESIVLVRTEEKDHHLLYAGFDLDAVLLSPKPSHFIIFDSGTGAMGTRTHRAKASYRGEQLVHMKGRDRQE